MLFDSAMIGIMWNLKLQAKMLLVLCLIIGAAFMQWNHILRWRQTKGRHVRPGSRVLFLDGGGVRGLVIIETLMEIEKRTGEKITDLFDWIVGTSTGGIVALGLVYGELLWEPESVDMQKLACMQH